jgi:hypothetical protein
LSNLLKLIRISRGPQPDCFKNSRAPSRSYEDSQTGYRASISRLRAGEIFLRGHPASPEFLIVVPSLNL